MGAFLLLKGGCVHALPTHIYVQTPCKNEFLKGPLLESIMTLFICTHCMHFISHPELCKSGNDTTQL